MAEARRSVFLLSTVYCLLSTDYCLLATASEVLAEELYRAAPGVGGRRGVVDLGAGVVEEGVVGAGVGVRLDGLAVLLKLLFEGADGLGRDGRVVLGEEAEDGRA